MYKIYDAFISYRRQEEDDTPLGSDLAHSIYAYLTAKGLRVFLDVENMEAGRFDEQLEWQVTHAPNYIFIATPAAMRFRKLPEPEVDYVEGELKLALKLYDENKTGDKALFPIVPHGVSVPMDSDTSYPAEVHGLFKHNVPTYLYNEIPTDKELKLIYEKVTEVKRRNLWNAGQRWLEDSAKEGHRFASLTIDKTILPLAGEQDRTDRLLPVRAHLEEKPDEPLMDMIAKTEGHLYLIGEGGMGKTTALFSIMRDTYGPGANDNDIDRNRYNGQVSLFIELSRAPDTYGKLYYGGRSTFIQRAVYQQIRTDLKVKQVSAAAVEEINEVFNLDPEEAVLPIRDLFTQQTPAPEYLLLLDGLNEVSRTEITYELREGAGKVKTGTASVVSMVLGEIRDLMTSCPNVRVILTSRSRETFTSGTKVTHLYLSGIADAAMRSYLGDRAEVVFKNKRLKEILRIPLFLTIYGKLTGDQELLTRGEILNLFFHQKKDALYSQRQRDEEIEQGIENAAAATQPERPTARMLSFILDFILPEIAWNMVKQDSFQIGMIRTKGHAGLEEIILHVLNDTSDTAVCGIYGRQAFQDYLSPTNPKQNTRRTAKLLVKALSGDETDEDETAEELTGNILDCILMALGIMRTDGREYSFIHHHIRDYFAAVYQINKLHIALAAFEAGEVDTARLCLTDLKESPLPAMTRQFIGEALGEAHNAPICDEKGNWHYNVPKDPCERNLIKRAFDLFRGRFDRQDGYCVWNLLQILKEVRKDLRGEDLSNLDLSTCEFNGCSLGSNGCVAKIQDSLILGESFFFRGHTGRIDSVNYSSDGKYIVTASCDGTAKIWDAKTLQEVKTINKQPWGVKFAIFSPNGDHLIIDKYDENSAEVWDTKNMSVFGYLIGHSGLVSCACYSPDGTRIVTGSFDCTAKIWDAETRQVIYTLEGHTDWLESVSYSPNGRYIVTVSQDGSAKVWDAKTFQEIKTLQVQTGLIVSASYSPDNKHIITAQGDNTAKIWDTDSFQIKESIEHNGIVTSVSYSRDGRYVITVSNDHTLKIWDAETLDGISIKRESIKFRFANFSPDGNYVITTSEDNNVRIWSAKTLTETGTLKGYTYSGISARFTHDGKHIVIESIAESKDCITTVWDAEELRVIGSTKGYIDKTDKSASEHYSVKNGQIITDTNNQALKNFRNEDLSKIIVRKGFTDGDIFVVYSPENRFAITYFWFKDGSYIIETWNTETLEEMGTLNEHLDPIASVEYSPDGKYIITASFDCTAKIWDAKTSKVLKTLSEHSDGVTSACYSPDGSYILTASLDGTAKIWDAETFECLHTIYNIPGLEVIGVDLRHLHPDSQLSDEVKEQLYKYGAIVDERG